MEGRTRVAEESLYRGGIATNLGHSITTIYAQQVARSAQYSPRR